MSEQTYSCLCGNFRSDGTSIVCDLHAEIRRLREEVERMQRLNAGLIQIGKCDGEKIAAHRVVMRALAEIVKRDHEEGVGHLVSECPSDCQRAKLLNHPLVVAAREEGE